MKALSKTLLLGVAVSLLGSCGKDVTPPPEKSGITTLENLGPANGNFRVIATDAPFSFGQVTSAKVNINRIEVKSISDVSTSLIGQPLVLDLVNLTNGLVTPVVDLNLPPGEYKELNLIIETGSIDLASGEHYNLKIPSGSTSGLKVFISPPIKITTSLSTDLLIDFDMARSFVPQGNTKANQITGFHFKPVLRAANLTTAGTLSGKVMSDNGTVSTADDVGLSGAVVKVFQNGSEYSTAVADANGNYKIIGLPEGAYSFEVSSEGYQPSSASNFSITAGNVTSAEEVLLSKRAEDIMAEPSP